MNQLSGRYLEDFAVGQTFGSGRLRIDKVKHEEYATSRSFDDVIAAFETVVGNIEEIGWTSITSAAKDAADFENRVAARIGSSGFTRFLTIDHGNWLSRFRGVPAQARVYTIGNPLSAEAMLRQDLAAGLNVAVRLMIYRDDISDTTRLVYDRPSTLMSGLGNNDLNTAAGLLDEQLAALAESVTGYGI
jgi:uncharacterized protein (DUF302 family)